MIRAAVASAVLLLACQTETKSAADLRAEEIDRREQAAADATKKQEADAAEAKRREQQAAAEKARAVADEESARYDSQRAAETDAIARGEEKQRRDMIQQSADGEREIELRKQAREACRWQNVPRTRYEYNTNSRQIEDRHVGFISSIPVCRKGTPPEVLAAALRIAGQMSR